MITIKDLFEHWDVSRQDVCKALDIPYRTLQNWLTGKRKCPDYMVLLLDEWMNHHCYPKNIDSTYCYKSIKYYEKKVDLWKDKLLEQHEIELSENE